MIRSILRKIGTAGLAMSAASALAQANYTLVSGDYRLGISPRYCETVRSISYQGCELGRETGYYGTVMAVAPGKFIGAGHTEGGKEKVLSRTLNCDGKTIEPVPGQTYQGNLIVLEKISLFDQAVFLTRIQLSPEGIAEQKYFITRAEQKFYSLYVNLFCWDKATTDYYALKADGEQVSGKFDGKKAWHLSSEVRWSAIYDANAGKGMLMYYPEIIKGAIRKACFWEVPKAYNKFYMMAAIPPAVPAGYRSQVYSVVLRGFDNPDNLPAAVSAAAAMKIPVPGDIPGEFIKQQPVAEKQKTTERKMTFDSDYTGREEVSATTAAGDKTAKILFRDKAEFNFDTMAHSIRGLKVGKDQASLRYATEGNLPSGEGTLETTFAGEWAGNDDKMHVLAQSGPSNAEGVGKFYIYKFKKNGIAAYFELNKTGEKLFLNYNAKDWKPDEWHHVLVSYSPEKIDFYVDGVLRKSGKLSEIKTWPSVFTVGPAYDKLGRDAVTTIANFTIYDKAVNPQEAAAIAKRRLPQLNLAVETAAPDGNAVILDPSPWFKDRPKVAMEALADDTVPPPWTPIELNDAKIKVWNRVYDFSGDKLIRSIIGGGAELLAAPATLKLDGRDLSFGPVRIVKSGKGRIVFERPFKTPDNVGGKVTCTVEYDGMIWCSLQLNPAGGKLNRLSLRMPLSARNAELLHYVGAPKVYESQNLVKNSFSMALPSGKGTVWQSPFRTNVWIGNNDGGLLWFTESDEFYFPKDNDDLISITRDEEGNAELAVNMVNAPASGLPAEVRYEFGLMATPVKPLPQGWRAFTFSAQYESFQGLNRGNQLIYWPDRWRAMMLDPEPHRALNLDKNRAMVRDDVAHHRKIIPYWTRLHYSTRDGDKVNPDGTVLDKEWVAIPRRPGGGTHQYDRASLTSPWQDYLVWCTTEWSKVFGGGIDGVYMDETQPIPNSNPASGGGYDDVFTGKRRPTYESLASRNLIKRINYAIWQKTGDEAHSVAHCSATHTMPSTGHYMAMLIGEHVYSGYFRNRNPEFLPPENDRLYYYSYALPMDRVRTECYHRQWGAVMLWLPCLKDQKDLMILPVPTRDMLSRIMQADMLVWPLFCNREEVVKTWKFREEFGIGAPGVEFIPYWEKQPVQSNTAEVVCGVYRDGDKALIIVSNLNRAAKEVRLKFTGLPLKSVKNAETLEAVEFSGDIVTLSIPRNDYRALRINY